MNLVKKITLDSMGLGKRVLRAVVKDEKTASIPVATVVGKTTAVEPVQTAFGESIRLKGEFLGTNLATGEIFTSSTAFIPLFIAQPLAAALQTSDSVEFAIELNVKYSTRECGYEFGVKSLLETKPANSLQDLMNRIQYKAPPLRIVDMSEADDADDVDDAEEKTAKTRSKKAV